MAAIIIRQAPPVIVPGLTRVYEIKFPVGTPKIRGDNTNSNRACIQLVQFFLRDFYDTHPQLRKKLQGAPGRFLLDGKVGPQTVSGIAVFQQHSRSTKVETVNVINDARVSVPIGATVPGTEFRWTIHALNLFFAAQTKNAATFASLFLNPAISTEAPELSAELTKAELLLP
jgi:hypothetical protein